MPKVIFEPVGMTCEASEGESLLEVAINHGVPLQHSCGGFCACATCHVKVLEGVENLSSMEEDEKERLETTAENPTPQSRLGCQARVQGQGEVRIEMVNVE